MKVIQVGFSDGPFNFWEHIDSSTHGIHVWYIYLHLPYKSTKCRQIYHTWMVWGIILMINDMNLPLISNCGSQRSKRQQYFVSCVARRRVNLQTGFPMCIFPPFVQVPPKKMNYIMSPKKFGPISKFPWKFHLPPMICRGYVSFQGSWFMWCFLDDLHCVCIKMLLQQKKTDWDERATLYNIMYNYM